MKTTDRAASIKDIRERHNYWNEVYSRKSAKISPNFPSQFAAFCVSEIFENGVDQVIDLACGNGRDTLFFARHGFNVLAIEKSQSAIDYLAESKTHENIFAVANLDLVNDQLPVSKINNTRSAFYSRFFIHTLQTEEVVKFFENISTVMKTDEILMLEYRNHHDSNKFKYFDNHFRAYYKTQFISEIAQANNLECYYAIEGIGFAKWRGEDPSVTRQIFKKTGT
jgi:SAM-dependent methyltransferase